MDNNRRRRNLKLSSQKVGELYLRETKYKRVPIKTGALLRSTIMRMVNATKNFLIELSSNVYYAEWVYDHAKKLWKRRWFEGTAKDSKVLKRAEQIIVKGFFK